MGNSCQHSRFSVIQETEIDNNLLFKIKVVECECLDCLTKGNPTVFHKKIKQGALTNMVYSDQLVDPKQCDHSDFEVDQSTEIYNQRDTLGGTVLSMLSARLLETKEYFITAVARCKLCGSKFKVSCTYSNEKVWDNYVQHTIENRSKWQIVTIDVPSNQTKKEIQYVSS